jgi:hypothetical protein
VAWCIPDYVIVILVFRSVVVDAAPGQPFEAHFVDLNNDGKMEVIASAFDTR